MTIPFEIFTLFFFIAIGTAIFAFRRYDERMYSLIRIDIVISLISMFFFFICAYAFLIGVSVNRTPAPETFQSGGTALIFCALGIMMASIFLSKLFSVLDTPFKNDFKNDF